MQINHVLRLGAMRPGVPLVHPLIFRKSSPRGRDHVAFRHVGHFKVTPYAVKLPADVRVAVPAVVVEFTQTRETLAALYSTPSLFIHRTDGFVGELGPSKPTQTSPTAGAKCLWEVHHEDGAVFEFSVLAKRLHPLHVHQPIRPPAIPQCGCPSGGRGLRWCVSGRPSCFQVGRR